MNPPSLFDRLIGNPLSALIILLGTLIVCFAAIGGSATPIAAFSMLCLCGWSWSANRRLHTYRLWKLEWDSMSGTPPPAKRPRKVKPPKQKSARATEERDMVSVMVALPRKSPTIMDAYSALPRYCERVIRSGSR
jgi:hypothetical protein